MIKLAMALLRGTVVLTGLACSVVIGMSTGNWADFVFALIVGSYFIVAIDFTLGLISDVIPS